MASKSRYKISTLKFGHIIVSIAAIVLTIAAFTTDIVTNDNIIWTTLHYQNSRADRPARGSLNYTLYFQENSNRYRVGANWAECFDYESFTALVKYAEPVKVATRKTNGWFYADNPEVVGLVANNVNFVNRDCINEDTRSQKTWLPIVDVIVIIAGFFIWRKNKTLKREASNTKVK